VDGVKGGKIRSILPQSIHFGARYEDATPWSWATLQAAWGGAMTPDGSPTAASKIVNSKNLKRKYVMPKN